MNALGRKSSEQTVRAGQMRAMDGILFIEYLKGKERHKDFLADFFYHRFRPELKRATDAWLATKPFQNPQAPPHPLVMEEYSLEPEQEAKRLSEETAQKFEEAEQANQNSDDYVMLTVLFASVMFFGGISTQFKCMDCRLRKCVYYRCRWPYFPLRRIKMDTTDERNVQLAEENMGY